MIKLLHKWLTTLGKFVMLMGRTFSVPERFRMFWKQYVKEMLSWVSTPLASCYSSRSS